jgi:hypothetical protein
MNRRNWLGLAWALALGVVGLVGGRADAGFEQSYSGWHKSPYAYYYRYYHSLPNTHDYVICYPDQPRYLYYYNRVSKVYWGRFDFQTKGYSLLAEADRKGLLKDIPESKFPEPSDLPPVPGGQDGETVLAPPSDLPTDLPSGADVGPATTDAKGDADPGKPDKTPDPGTPTPPPAPGGGAVAPPNPGTPADAPKSPAGPGPGTAPPGTPADAPKPAVVPGPGTAPPDSGKPGTRPPPGKDGWKRSWPPRQP